jgi:glycosyltransferase involved in cell wall biosynthesis
MRILIAHNFYRGAAPSGEDAVFRNECALLESHGAEVIRFERYNDDVDESTFAKKVKLALSGAWSRESYADLRRLIRQTSPDIAHFHNTFPLISPSAYAACRDERVPVVQTVHNYRLSCANGLLLRDGKPCELCVGRWPFYALRYRCYRDSVLASGAQVWTMVSNRMRDTYNRLIDVFIVLTEFAAEKLRQGGVSSECIVVKPNALSEVPLEGRGTGGYALFVGRLGPEKGIKTLLDAWRDIPMYPLKIVGDGPLRAELEREASSSIPNVEFLGMRTKPAVFQLIRDAEFMLVPSVWYEGLPMVIVEAFACGTPVVASSIGGLAELVEEGETGVKFRPGDAGDLVRKVRGLRNDPEKLARMRSKARAVFLEHYTPDRNIERLLNIYDCAREKSIARLRGRRT